jgi:V-type H+-transporting ATPase subunit G
MEEDAKKDTEKTIEEIRKIGKDKGSKVVADLLNAVTDVKPVPRTKS